MIQKAPLISVIIPVYNAEQTLRKCIESVLDQDVSDFELILVDDGSTDGSPAICDEYLQMNENVGADLVSARLPRTNRNTDGPVVRIIHKLNGGVSSARNAGLDIARGEWVTFVDSDDSIGENFFHDVADAKEELLIRGYFMHDMHGREVEKLVLDNLLPQPVLRDFIRYYIAAPLLRGPVLKFYKRKIIGNLRFPEDMKVGEDTWFVWSYFSRISTYKILYYYYYYYYVTTDMPSEVKYRSETDYAIRSLQHLRDAFGTMSERHGISRSQFMQFIGYFKSISKGDWEREPSRWYSNPDVKLLYAYVWADLSVMQKLRLTIARILRK